MEYGTSALTSSFEELDSNLATTLFAKAVDLRSGQRRVLGKNREMLNILAAQNLHVGQERAQSHPYLLATNTLSDFPIGQEKNGNRFAPITQLGHYGKETGIAARNRLSCLVQLFTDPSILGLSVVISTIFVSVDWITSHAKGDGRVLIFTHSRQNIKKNMDWTREIRTRLQSLLFSENRPEKAGVRFYFIFYYVISLHNFISIYQ